MGDCRLGLLFISSTLDEKRKPSKEFYRQASTNGFSIKVADHLYLADAYKDSIYNRIGRQAFKVQ